MTYIHLYGSNIGSHRLILIFAYVLLLSYMQNWCFGMLYVNVSVLIKFSQETREFTLIIIISSPIKSYVFDMYLNRLGEAILIHIHNI